MLTTNNKNVIKTSVASWGWTKTGHSAGNNQDSFLNWSEHLLWAVADGVGNSLDGALASSMLIEKLTEIKVNTCFDRKIQEILEALASVNASLWAKRTDKSLCATTVTLLTIHGSKASCIWSGDSRCYMMRNNILYQCTRDHTLRQEHIDKGSLSIPEAIRMVKGNIITKAVGANSKLDFERIDFNLEPGDRFMLCTDGLTDLVTVDMISNILQKSSNVLIASEHFEHLIKNRYQKDNITQITVFVSN